MHQTQHMKRYFYFLPFILLFTSCEKILLEKKITKKLFGTWRINDIKITWGNTLYAAYNFKYQKFTFKKENKQELTSAANNTYTVKWFLIEDKRQTDCYTAPAGNTVCSDIYVPVLTADTWIPTTNEKKAVDFADVKFTSDNSFVATISPNPVTTYQYYFTKEQ